MHNRRILPDLCGPWIWMFLAISLLFSSHTLFAQQSSAADSLLVEQIIQELSNDARLPEKGITISALNGIVRLSGVVPTLAQKEWALAIVYNVPGVRAVDKRLLVDPPHVSDSELERMVAARLSREPDSIFAGIQVRAKNGKVTLYGRVRSWGERYTAYEIVSLIRGVAKISDNLKIRDTENQTDEQITRAVEEALRKKIKMDMDYAISVRTVRGVVRLKGRVRTDAEKSNAIQTTLFIPGVADIVDKIEVLPE